MGDKGASWEGTVVELDYRCALRVLVEIDGEILTSVSAWQREYEAETFHVVYIRECDCVRQRGQKVKVRLGSMLNAAGSEHFITCIGPPKLALLGVVEKRIRPSLTRASNKTERFHYNILTSPKRGVQESPKFRVTSALHPAQAWRREIHLTHVMPLVVG